MANLEESMTKIIREHESTDFAGQHPGYGCRCGEDFENYTRFSQHLAASLISELGLSSAQHKS